MFVFLQVLMGILAVLLCIMILVQAAKGGGLAASFGGASSSTDSFMGGRQAATALTKGTWIGGGLFLFLALVMAIMSARPSQAPESILRQGAGGQQGLSEAPPSLLDALPPGADTSATGASDATGGGSQDDAVPPDNGPPDGN